MPTDHPLPPTDALPEQPATPPAQEAGSAATGDAAATRTPVTAPGTATPAFLGLRLAAAVYDAFPLLALWFLAAGLAVAVTGGALDVHRFAGKALVQVLVLAASAGYLMTSWVRGGQTVGMKPWRLRVVRADGGSVTWRQAALRFVVAIASLAALGLGFIWCLVDRDRRSWHDIAADTLLVRMAKPPRA